MAFNFPSSPAIGQESSGFVWDGQKWVKSPPGDATVASTPPVPALPGQLWWDSTDGVLYIYYADATSSQWVQADSSSSAFVSKTGDAMTGGLSITTSAGLSPAFYVVQTASGTAPAAVSFNEIIVVDNVSAGSGAFAIGLNVAQVINGGAAVEGGREAIQGYLELRGATSATNPNRFYVGGEFIASATHHDGGTDLAAGAKGSLVGMSGWADAQSGATNLSGAVGCELNVSLRTGSSARYKGLLTLNTHLEDAVKGAELDFGLAFSNGGSVALDDGILFSDVSGLFPVSGNILRTIGGSFTNGINLSSSTISGLAYSSPGFSVNGIGVANIAAAVTSTIYGGLAAGSSLTLVSTAANGTTDYVDIKTGNIGATQAGRFTHLGGLAVGSTAIAAGDPGSGVVAAANLVLAPPASVTPAVNGQMTFELTSNTQLKIKVKGSDGVVRSVTLTLA